MSTFRRRSFLLTPGIFQSEEQSTKYKCQYNTCRLTAGGGRHCFCPAPPLLLLLHHCRKQCCLSPLGGRLVSTPWSHMASCVPGERARAREATQRRCRLTPLGPTRTPSGDQLPLCDRPAARLSSPADRPTKLYSYYAAISQIDTVQRRPPQLTAPKLVV